jgi:membrane associated rhomboid family serine protease
MYHTKYLLILILILMFYVLCSSNILNVSLWGIFSACCAGILWFCRSVNKQYIRFYGSSAEFTCIKYCLLVLALT